MNGVELGHGFRVLELGAVPSTNDVARELADEGEPAGLFVQAAQQTAGRGRHGRSWQSPPGNLYTSLILRPARPMAEVATCSLVVALALAEAVDALSAGTVQPRLKWPNDVLLDGAKLAGILLEATSDGLGSCQWLIVGIGVNVATAPGAAVPYPTTSLAAAGLELTPERLLAGLAASLRPRLAQWAKAGFGPLRAPWLARAAGLGGPAAVRFGEHVARGRMVDIDETGAFGLEYPSGEVERFTTGEVKF